MFVILSSEWKLPPNGFEPESLCCRKRPFCQLCHPVWPDFRHFGKSLHVFGKIFPVYFLFDKMLKLLWQICYISGLIFVVVNGQILKLKSNHPATLATTTTACESSIFYAQSPNEPYSVTRCWNKKVAQMFSKVA